METYINSEFDAINIFWKKWKRKIRKISGIFTTQISQEKRLSATGDGAVIHHGRGILDRLSHPPAWQRPTILGLNMWAFTTILEHFSMHVLEGFHHQHSGEICGHKGQGVFLYSIVLYSIQQCMPVTFKPSALLQ